jgi:hypothetical protein
LDLNLNIYGLKDGRQGSPCENQNGSHLKGDSSSEVPTVTFQAFSTENPKNSSRKLTSEK